MLDINICNTNDGICDYDYVCNEINNNDLDDNDIVSHN